MTNTGLNETGPVPDRTPPYGDLYIYYLDGRLPPKITPRDEAFIGNWEEDGFSFLFFSKPADETVERLIIGQPRLTLIDRYHMTYDEWHGEALCPLYVGRFIISPPWCRVDSPGTRSMILLDPGVVFGTGTHPTTRDCLKALELAYGDFVPETVLDLGTGTGLLAVASQFLGPGMALAVDFNYLAARTAGKNIRLNGLENRILAVQGKAEEYIDVPADLVVANIHYDIMRHIVVSNGFSRKKRFILSGLMAHEAEKILNALSGTRARVLKNWTRDGIWHTFYGTLQTA